jgi:Tfp pilus assembly protein PilN
MQEIKIIGFLLLSMEIKLNLIPNYKREEIKKTKSLRFAMKEGIFLAFILAFLFSGMFSFERISKMNLDLVSGVSRSGNKKKSFEEVKQMEEEFGKINEAISRTEKIQKEHLYWSQVFLKLNTLIPKPVAINSLFTKNYKILIVGTSKDRDSLLEFKANLEKEECFSSISLPLSDLITKDNVDFQMDFNVGKNCLKKQ